jgi:hypothetical protein
MLQNYAIGEGANYTWADLNQQPPAGKLAKIVGAIVTTSAGWGLPQRRLYFRHGAAMLPRTSTTLRSHQH